MTTNFRFITHTAERHAHVAADVRAVARAVVERVERRVARAFASLRGKKLSNPWKKHDNIPL